MSPTSVFEFADDTLTHHTRKSRGQGAAVNVCMLAVNVCMLSVNGVVPGTNREQRRFMLDCRANWAAPFGGRDERDGVFELVQHVLLNHRLSRSQFTIEQRVAEDIPY